MEKTFQQLLQYVGASMAFRWPSIWRQLALPHLAQQVAAGLDNHLGLLTGGRRTLCRGIRHCAQRWTGATNCCPSPSAWFCDALPRSSATLRQQRRAWWRRVARSPHRRWFSPWRTSSRKSLVTVEVGSVTAYYRLHETTRGYALEKLAESGEFEQVARRHANYCRDLFDSAETELETLPAPAWLARYGRHVGQARAALDWAFSPTGAAEVGVALTVAAVRCGCTCR